MPQKNFSATVSSWVKASKERMDAVYKSSAQAVIERMQTPVGAGGALPIDTGFLRASLQVNLGAALPPLRSRPRDAEAIPYDAGAVSLTISGATVKDTITAAYGARYAVYVEYGARGRPGRRFVGLAAQRWPQTVAAVGAEAQRRAGR